MRIIRKILLGVIVGLGLSTIACCADLIDVYQQALENDPTFKQAYSIYLSSSESIPQAKSALYPQLILNTQGNRTSFSAVGDFSANGSALPPGAPASVIAQTYNSLLLQVKATQAIFNYQAWALVKEAKATVKASQATFNDAAQNLILRTAKAYFDVLLAADTLTFAEAKKLANKRQLEQAEQRFRVGLDPITSVYEARASYDQSVAEVITTNNAKINKSEDLRKLTNHEYDYLAPLRESKIPLIKPEPDNVDEWIHTSLKQNYSFYAEKYTLDAARENIKVQASGSWPTLSLVGNSTRTNNDVENTASSFFIPTEQTVNNVALVISYPLFQGGLVQSKTRQAQFDYAAASEKLERIYRDVGVNSRIAFNSIMDGISKVKADRQTVNSQQLALESTEAQFQVGTRTMVDVLNAQRRLFEVQRELASDQYNLINAILELKYLAGTLSVQDLEEVNAWLRTTRYQGFAKLKR